MGIVDLKLDTSSNMDHPVSSTSMPLSVATLNQQSVVFTTVPANSTILNNALLNNTQTISLGPVTSSHYQPLQQQRLHNSDLESDNDDQLLCHTQHHAMVHIKESHSSPEQSPLTSPGLLSPGLQTPCDNFHDTNTQMSLVEVSSKLNIVDEASSMGTAVDVDSSSLWGMVDADHAEGVNHDQFRKVRKSSRKSDASSCVHSETEEEITGFDANGAISTSQFVFSKFGTEVPSMFSSEANEDVSSNGMSSVSKLTNCSVISANVVDSTSSSPPPQPPAVPTSTSSSSRDPDGGGGGMFLAPQPVKRVKVKKTCESSLSLTYPRSAHGNELKILVQPEEQHRARYMTEGSRGAIKDQSGQNSPQIQLFGFNRTVTCQIFIGSDAGKVRPHGFYQACRVAGRNSTPCTEKDMEGTTVIEVELDPRDNMIASIDCVGILKLRNADVEQRIGIARSKKKSTRVRMVFRVVIPSTEGPPVILQAASTPISCTQPAGQPEVSKKSLSECGAAGGKELFVIGKNFVKQGAKVVFQEKEMRNGKDVIVWQQKAELDQEHFQQTHLICTVPPYREQNISDPANVEIVIHCANRTSEAVPFTYTVGGKSDEGSNNSVGGGCSSGNEAAAAAEPALPDQITANNVVKREETESVPMETDSQPTRLNKLVSPVALAMNELFAKAAKEGGGAAPSLLSSLPSMKAALQQQNKQGGGANSQLADTLTELQVLLNECSSTSSGTSQVPITVEPDVPVHVLKQENNKQDTSPETFPESFPETFPDTFPETFPAMQQQQQQQQEQQEQQQQSGGFKLPTIPCVDNSPPTLENSHQSSPAAASVMAESQQQQQQQIVSDVFPSDQHMPMLTNSSSSGSLQTLLQEQTPQALPLEQIQQQQPFDLVSSQSSPQQQQPSPPQQQQYESSTPQTSPAQPQQYDQFPQQTQITQHAGFPMNVTIQQQPPQVTQQQPQQQQQQQEQQVLQQQQQQTDPPAQPMHTEQQQQQQTTDVFELIEQQQQRITATSSNSNNFTLDQSATSSNSNNFTLDQSNSNVLASQGGFSMAETVSSPAFSMAISSPASAFSMASSNSPAFSMASSNSPAASAFSMASSNPFSLPLSQQSFSMAVATSSSTSPSIMKLSPVLSASATSTAAVMSPVVAACSMSMQSGYGSPSMPSSSPCAVETQVSSSTTTTSISSSSSSNQNGGSGDAGAIELLQQARPLQNAVVNQLASSIQGSEEATGGAGAVDLYKSLQELIGLMKVQNEQISQLARQQSVKEEPVEQDQQQMQQQVLQQQQQQDQQVLQQQQQQQEQQVLQQQEQQVLQQQQQEQQVLQQQQREEQVLRQQQQEQQVLRQKQQEQQVLQQQEQLQQQKQFQQQQQLQQMQQQQQLQAKLQEQQQLQQLNQQQHAPPRVFEQQQPIGTVTLAASQSNLTLQQLLERQGLQLVSADQSQVQQYLQHQQRQPQQQQQQQQLQHQQATPQQQQQQQGARPRILTAEMVNLVKQEVQQQNIQITSMDQIANLLQQKAASTNGNIQLVAPHHQGPVTVIQVNRLPGLPKGNSAPR